MADAEVGAEIGQFAAVRRNHRPIGQPAQDLEVMTLSERIDRLRRSVNDDTSACRSSPRLVGDEVRRQQRAMLARRTAKG